MTELYHASNREVPRPLVSVGRADVDFGRGFYLTRIRAQAERWAKRMAKRFGGEAVVNVYDFDHEQAQANCARWLALPEYNKEWLDFVVACRRGEAVWQDYDVIEGCVADDNVIDTVSDYFDGYITQEQALGRLLYEKPTHQLCLSRQGVVDKYLTFKGSYTI